MGTTVHWSTGVIDMLHFSLSFTLLPRNTGCTSGKRDDTAVLPYCAKHNKNRKETKKNNKVQLAAGGDGFRARFGYAIVC